MTKRDYVAVAGVISEQMAAGCDRAALTAVAHSLCDVFSGDNPNFSRDTFMKACGCSVAAASPPLRRGKGRVSTYAHPSMTSKSP